MTDNTTNPTIQTSPCSAQIPTRSILSLEESSLSTYEWGRYCCCSGLGSWGSQSNVAPPLLGEYTSVSIVLSCPDNSIKVFFSIKNISDLLCAESPRPQLFEIIRRTPLLYYVDLTLVLSAVGEWRWYCQSTIWAFGMLSHRDGEGRRRLLVWLLVLAVAITGLRSTLHFNTYKPCPDLLLFSQYWTDVLSSTNCIKKNAN